MKPQVVHIHPSDNVAVAVRPLEAGETVSAGGARVVLREEVRAGHKIALRALAPGEAVVKYGFPIGRVTEPVEPGGVVHVHNLRTALEGKLEYAYRPGGGVPVGAAGDGSVPTFQGFRRKNGRVGTRNEIWVLNTVGCVNTACLQIAQAGTERLRGTAVEGVYTFSHPYGCSQLGDDLSNTQRVLAGLIRHPNAGGVLLVGLGCENNQMKRLLEVAGEVDPERIRFFNTQEVDDEFEAGMEALDELAAAMAGDRREPCPASELVIGLKCGGSDGFSGISANPLVGRVADRLTALGGTAVLTEVPEMFGAEQILMNRARDERTFGEVVRMINDFKDYFLRHGQPIYENPSPGNKDGGLTTLEEKSLGATQKGGQATVTQVLGYGDAVREKGGLALLFAPGNDAVSATALTASGVTVLLFTTGRGTPLGFPVPTVKISSNTPIYEKKPHWIDFNAGALLDGAGTMEALADELFELVLRVASGEQRTNNERHGYREIAIWKEGVTL